jgi:iron(III) transport system substrate-binding protein
MTFPAVAAAALIALAHAAAAQDLVPEAARSFGAEDASERLLVRGTTDLALFEPVLAAFAAEAPGLGVDYEQWASNDLYLAAEAACRGAFPSADLLISSSVDQHVKLVNDGCAQPHRSAATAALVEAANWRDEIFGVTSEPAVMIYNRELVPSDEAPHSRFDLLDLLRPPESRYAGRVATYDIEASGLGYLFAFADSRQATTFGSLIEAFGRTGAVATCCSAEIIDGVASGRYLVAYNVLGSYALARAAEDPRIAVVAPEDYTLVLARGAMIPRRARNPDAAGALVDFLLSEPGQEALTRAYLVVDVTELLPGADDAVVRAIPLSPVLLVGLDRQKRARFLDLWRETFPAE